MKISIILKDLMIEEGISLGKLSKAVKVPVSTLHGWLNGIEPKSLTQLKKVNDYFGITIDELCFENKQKKHTGNFLDYEDEIKAGVFEVVLRKVKKSN